jgi:hypothetical protein
MKLFDYFLLVLIVFLLLLSVSCEKEDERCITYEVEQYQQGETLCENGVCEETYITEIYCSYYEANR